VRAIPNGISISAAQMHRGVPAVAINSYRSRLCAFLMFLSPHRLCNLAFTPHSSLAGLIKSPTRNRRAKCTSSVSLGEEGYGLSLEKEPRLEIERAETRVPLRDLAYARAEFHNSRIVRVGGLDPPLAPRSRTHTRARARGRGIARYLRIRDITTRHVRQSRPSGVLPGSGVAFWKPEESGSSITARHDKKCRIGARKRRADKLARFTKRRGCTRFRACALLLLSVFTARRRRTRLGL